MHASKVGRTLVNENLQSCVCPVSVRDLKGTHRLVYTYTLGIHTGWRRSQTCVSLSRPRSHFSSCPVIGFQRPASEKTPARMKSMVSSQTHVPALQRVPTWGEEATSEKVAVVPE